MAKQNIKDTSSSSSPSWFRGTCVGRGCFGAVSTAVSKSDGIVFAVKSVDLSTCLPVQSRSLENEIRVLRWLEPHPCVVKYLGDDASKEGTTSYRNLHLEYLPHGTVAGVAADEGQIRRWAWCLVSALRHIHSHGIVHCDVKGKNVLIGPDPLSVKLTDFGSATKFGEPTAPIVPRGSPLWMAPEVIRGEYQGPESDVWSLGCTVIEMFTGKPAWEDRGVDSLSQIGYSNELPRFPAGLSELGRDFLYKCLKRDPRQRWRCDQLLEHPFLSGDHYSLSADSSPRCVLDWVNSVFDGEEVEDESESGTGSRTEPEISAMARICKLATAGGTIWESDDWVEVRGYAFEEEGTSKEYPNSTSAGSENKGAISVYPPAERVDVETYVQRANPEFNGDYTSEWQYICSLTQPRMVVLVIDHEKKTSVRVAGHENNTCNYLRNATYTNCRTKIRNYSHYINCFRLKTGKIDDRLHPSLPEGGRAVLDNGMGRGTRVGWCCRVIYCYRNFWWSRIFSYILYLSPILFSFFIVIMTIIIKIKIGKIYLLFSALISLFVACDSDRTVPALHGVFGTAVHNSSC